MTTKDGDTIDTSWKDIGFGTDMSKKDGLTSTNEFISGESFDARLDELQFNRMIQFKSLQHRPQGNDPGKTYYDRENKKLYMWIDATGQWAEILYTTTSTSTTTTSSSSSSTSTTTTSSSTSSTSTSTS